MPSLSPQLYPIPELTLFPCFFPLATLAGFFHCSFLNTINYPHTSSFFSSLSISGLPFSRSNPKPSQDAVGIFLPEASTPQLQEILSIIPFPQLLTGFSQHSYGVTCQPPGHPSAPGCQAHFCTTTAFPTILQMEDNIKVDCPANILASQLLRTFLFTDFIIYPTLVPPFPTHTYTRSHTLEVYIGCSLGMSKIFLLAYQTSWTL